MPSRLTGVSPQTLGIEKGDGKRDDVGDSKLSANCSLYLLPAIVKRHQQIED
jgi:hypothetical protein